MKGPQRQRHLPQIGLDHRDHCLTSEPPPQPPGEHGIEFDRDNRGAGGSQRPGQRTVARTQIKHQVTGSDTTATHQQANLLPIGEKMRARRVSARPPGEPPALIGSARPRPAA